MLQRTTRRLPYRNTATLLGPLLWLSLLPAPAGCGEADAIAEVLALQPGQTVADIGAGDGEWSEELSQRVGADGRVLATEIDDWKVDRLQDRFRDAGLHNAEAVLASDEATGLPPGSCNAILIRMVYHHLTEPARIVADLQRALRPGGRLAVIDFVPQEHLPRIPGVPDRGGHGVPPEEVIAEMERAGLRLIERHDEWEGRPERFCIVFAAGASSTSRADRTAPVR